MFGSVACEYLFAISDLGFRFKMDFDWYDMLKFWGLHLWIQSEGFEDDSFLLWHSWLERRCREMIDAREKR